MAEHSKYYRPIQYLGSKIRVVDTIVKECQKLHTPGNYVLDLFSGSSIVAQSLYNNGMNVIANDTMSFPTLKLLLVEWCPCIHYHRNLWSLAHLLTRNANCWIKKTY